MKLEWVILSADELEVFLADNSFHYMFFNSYIYKPYLKKLARYGLRDSEDNGKIYGVAMLETRSTPSYEERNVLHIAFLPTLRGKIAKKMAKEWLSMYLSCYKVIEGHVPKKWPAAAKFASWLNFKTIAETPQYYIVELRE